MILDGIFDLFEMFKGKKEPAPPPPKTPKEIADEKGEPYISILKVDLDPANPRYGSFELDWNSRFLDKLVIAGYKGDSEEALVEQWFQDVCRHVVLESYEQEQSSIAEGDNIVRYVNRTTRDDGKTEVS